MIQLQFLNKMLDEHTMALATLNNIDVTFFPEYEEEFKFISDHNDKYGMVPDKETFLEHFPDFNFILVQESPAYLVDALREDYTYRKSLNVFKTVNEEMVSGDSRKAVEILLSKIPELTAKLNVEAVDILHEGAKTRFNEYCDKGQNIERYFVSTGLKELDDLIGGWSKANDLVAICARPGIGKSWMLDYFLYNAAKNGLTVALYSGEMSESQVGYRVDTFISNISNFKLSKGYNDVFDDYQTHINAIQDLPGKFYVCTPNTLGGVATVPKLKAFCERYKVDILGVDQYSLMDDVKNNRQRADKYESISKDLKIMQVELGIPVLVNAQLNRGAVSSEVDSPGTEHLAGSDRISQDASTIITITKREQNMLVLSMIKVRDAATGGKLVYEWDIDHGTLKFVSDGTEDSGEEIQQSQTDHTTRQPRNQSSNNNSVVGGDIDF